MKQIPLYRNREIVAHTEVDDDDFEELSKHTWHITEAGYAKRMQTIYLHREVLGLDADAGNKLYGDHMNGDPLDNTRENLRVVTSAQNRQNVRKRKGAKSKYVGVDLHKRTGRWRARGCVEGKHTNLGYCDTEDEAGEARREWEREFQPYRVQSSTRED